MQPLMQLVPSELEKIVPQPNFACLVQWKVLKSGEEDKDQDKDKDKDKTFEVKVTESETFFRSEDHFLPETLTFECLKTGHDDKLILKWKTYKTTTKEELTQAWFHCASRFDAAFVKSLSSRGFRHYFSGKGMTCTVEAMAISFGVIKTK